MKLLVTSIYLRCDSSVCISHVPISPFLRCVYHVCVCVCVCVCCVCMCVCLYIYIIILQRKPSLERYGSITISVSISWPLFSFYSHVSTMKYTACSVLVFIFFDQFCGHTVRHGTASATPRARFFGGVDASWLNRHFSRNMLS